MKIALDLSVLQTGHKMRGIGAVVINFVNNLSTNQKEANQFVFFIEKSDPDDTVYNMLNLDGVTYQTRYLRQVPQVTLPGKLNRAAKLVNILKATYEYRIGDKRIDKEDLADIDAFIQFEQGQKLPYGSRKHTTVILYDIIPYVMESDYLWSYTTARLNGRTRRSALKSAVKRRQYITKLQINCRRAKHLVAISKHTRDDFIKYVGADPDKISVNLLGSNSSDTVEKIKDPMFTSYTPSVWGDVPTGIHLTEKPFLLFMGGADPRRQLVELAAAYNNLKSRGTDIKLVFAGDTMFGLSKLEHQPLKDYLYSGKSYIDDVHFLGYVSNEQRDWLYRNALAFVYPSLYEGFGLPVLEAMRNETPVITYDNSSIGEVAGNAALYAKDFLDISSHALDLLNNKSLRQSIIERGIKQSRKFTWRKTVDGIMDTINR